MPGPTTAPAQRENSSKVEQQQKQFLNSIIDAYLENPQAALKNIEQLSPQQRQDLMALFQEKYGKGMIAHFKAQKSGSLSKEDASFVKQLSTALYGEAVVQGSSELAKALAAAVEKGAGPGAVEAVLRDLAKRGVDVEKVKALLDEKLGEAGGAQRAMNDVGLDEKKVNQIIAQGKRQSKLSEAAEDGSGQAPAPNTQPAPVQLQRRPGQAGPRDGVDKVTPDDRPIYNPDMLDRIHKKEKEALKAEQAQARKEAEKAADAECKKYDKENVKLGNSLSPRHKQAKDAIRRKHLEPLDSKVRELEEKQAAECTANDKLRSEYGFKTTAEIKAERERETAESAADVAEAFDPTGAVGAFRRAGRVAKKVQGKH